MNSSPRYIAKLPNSVVSQIVIDLLRRYLNKDRYRLTVRSRGINNLARKEGKTWKDFTYSTPSKYASHLRLYIDEVRR